MHTKTLAFLFSSAISFSMVCTAQQDIPETKKDYPATTLVGTYGYVPQGFIPDGQKSAKIFRVNKVSCEGEKCLWDITVLKPGLGKKKSDFGEKGRVQIEGTGDTFKIPNWSDRSGSILVVRISEKQNHINYHNNEGANIFSRLKKID